MSLVKNSTIVTFGCLLITFFILGNAAARESLHLKKVFSGLGTPWGMAFLSNDLALVTEKRGVLSLLDFSNTPVKQTIVEGLPEIMQVGQGGLLDVKVGPISSQNNNFSSSPTVLYFTYVAASTVQGKTDMPTLKLAKAEFDGEELTQWKVLFEANNPQNGTRHFGSRITFDEQGHIFFSMGDRGERENSQDLDKHSGSVFRLNLDGSIPSDNPFVGQDNVRPEIWSYGHRNPQGLMFDKASKQLWSIEHGPRGGDEINLIEKGKNYGWPIISYGREYISNRKVSKTAVKTGMEQPVYYYTPSIAPGSLLVYSGKKIPEWRGALLSGALKLRHLNVVAVDSDNNFVAESRFFEESSERFRHIVESPEGDIFTTTDSGNIYQIIK